MKALISLTAFPNLSHYSIYSNFNEVEIEAQGTYQKQTFRNRYDIFGPNGKLPLTIPVIYSSKNKQLYRDVKISNVEKWQSQHLKSLMTAYNSSPFFEYYIDDLMPLFNTTYNFLFEYNLICNETLNACVQIDKDLELTTQFKNQNGATFDFRNLAKLKTVIPYNFKSYTQMFCVKHGFLPNLSILDLLFNEGPNTLNYLEQQTIKTE
ncbi:WbqC family protein [Winogradskyella maritima]|uniref:WbqC family protein n=1 Tax=Winogradskyella maritima TaxID=1517766 RepID=A0ABV8AMT1_9FLAO|nr:WbqC family protein [Winogradskyella maritima]